MTQFRKKPVVIEAISFEEFVQYAKENTAEPHWSIPYKGVNITQENATVYLIPTKEGVFNFTPNDVLITGIQGEIYPCKKDIFEATYEPVEKTTELTFEEAYEFLKIGECIALPEWSGFWFGNKNSEIIVLTKEGEITKTHYEIFKVRNDWMVVEPNEVQQKLLKEYFNGSPETYSFGGAIVALKRGQLVARKGWNGKGMFIVKQIPALIGLDIIPKMQSLPQSAKDKFIANNQTINYANQMLIVNSEGRADSWVPSSSDVFAEDWIILE